MDPVGQQRPQRRDERDRLVEHDVVTRDRDLDDGGDPAEPVVQDLALLRGDQAVFGPEQRDPARVASRSVTRPPMLCPMTTDAAADPVSATTASTSRAHVSRL